MAKVNEVMPLDIVRFIADTVHMDAEQTGAYVMGFMTQWNTGPLPNDTRECARIMRLHGSNAEAIVRTLFDRYFEQQPDGTWVNLSNQSRRLEAETKAKRYSERSVKANAVRWAGHTRKYAPRTAMGILQGAKNNHGGILVDSNRDSTMDSNKDSNGESNIGIPENLRLGEVKDSPSLRSGGRAAAPLLGPRDGKPRDGEAGKAKTRRTPAKMPQDAPETPGMANGSIRGKKIAPEPESSRFSGGKIEGSDPPKPLRAPDPRFRDFRREVLVFWRGANPGAVKYPWDKPDGVALNRLLRRNKALTLEQFRTCMVHRARSERVNTARPAHEWLEDLMRYAAGPLSRFGDLMQ